MTAQCKNGTRFANLTNPYILRFLHPLPLLFPFCKSPPSYHCLGKQLLVSELLFSANMRHELSINARKRVDTQQSNQYVLDLNSSDDLSEVSNLERRAKGLRTWFEVRHMISFKYLSKFVQNTMYSTCVSARCIQCILLSPSGDLGISLVWHNLSPPRLFGLSVEILFKVN